MLNKEYFLRHRGRVALFVVLFLTGFFCVYAPGARAQVHDEADTLKEKDVFFYQGDVIKLKVYSLTQIAVTKPGIVDISSVDVHEILLVGRAVGETTFFIWDEYGKRTVVVHVLEQNLDIIAERVRRLLETVNINTVIIEKNNYEGKLLLKGRVTKDKKKNFDLILQNYQGFLIDMTYESGELILVDVQITELNETLSKAFGFNWAFTPLNYEETLPEFDGSPGDWFKIGDFQRTSVLSAAVNALLIEGKARVLSKPRVVVEDGQSSSFLVGGEIPIPTTTATSGGTVQENIQFRSYGVNLTVTPEINGDKIDLQMNVSITDIDASVAVGDNVGFSNTSTNTRVSLDNGQTIIVAGLIKNNTSDTVSRIPYISNIPVLGALFRYRTTPNTDKEVVISLTPYVLSWDEEERKKPAQATQQEAQVAPLLEWDEDELDSGFLEMEAEMAPEEELIPQAVEEELSEETLSFFEEAVAPSDWTAEEDTDFEDVFLSEETPASRPDEQNVAQDVGLRAVKEAPPVPAPAMNISQAITAYAQGLQQKISQAIAFPLEAQKFGWEGTVRLTLSVLSDGTLSDAYVKESSGHKIFDMDAVNTAKVSAPFDPFPAEIDLEELTITIPIVYSQAAILDEAP